MRSGESENRFCDSIPDLVGDEAEIVDVQMQEQLRTICLGKLDSWGATGQGGSILWAEPCTPSARGHGFNSYQRKNVR